MKTLLMGGNGFIGSHLVDRLLREGHSVTVFDRRTELFREPLPGVRYVYGEFGNRSLQADTLEGIEIVFHLISTSVPKTSNDDPALDLQSNVIETIYFLEECVRRKIRKVVFVSSGGVIYGRSTDFPAGEDSPTEPECAYGISKLAIEKYLFLFRLLYGLDYVILRPSNPYGDRQNPFGIQGVIPVFLKKIWSGEPIEIWGSGEVLRDFLYIDDLIEGILLATFSESRSRLFNLGSGESVSLNRLLQIIEAVIGKRCTVVHLESRVFDIPRVELDIRRARQELGWRPRIGMKEGIRRTMDFVRTVQRFTR